jgi:phosphomannomutase
MLAEIGRREGFMVEETLTGFKWIGSRSDALRAEGKRNLFGYEEAIGFAW